MNQDVTRIHTHTDLTGIFYYMHSFSRNSNSDAETLSSLAFHQSTEHPRGKEAWRAVLPVVENLDAGRSRATTGRVCAHGRAGRNHH